MFKNRYRIERISYGEAMRIVLEKHYKHRKSPCSSAFGLVDTTTGEIKGVVVYGMPASFTLCEGICGKEEKGNVLELTRLWVDDDVPKNGESFLIGNTLKLLDKEIIVSFSEIKEGHYGGVYQATNFIYCGLSAKRTDRKRIDGQDKHNRHTSYDKEGTVLVPRPRKHRYVFFNTNRRRKKELLRKLRYEILPYPKFSDIKDDI